MGDAGHIKPNFWRYRRFLPQGKRLELRPKKDVDVCGRQQKTLENYTRAIVGVPPSFVVVECTARKEWWVHLQKTISRTVYFMSAAMHQTLHLPLSKRVSVVHIVSSSETILPLIIMCFETPHEVARLYTIDAFSVRSCIYPILFIR